MDDPLSQAKRLDLLVEAFKNDSIQYKDYPTPEDTEGKRKLLRSLMNIRMPKTMDASVLSIQDDYLRERIREDGITQLSDIPILRNGMCLWQGDITRLAADAIVNAANSQMLGCFVPMHTCIDNCIHTFAGIQLREECYRQMEQLRKRFGEAYEQPTSIPMLTDGFNLPAKKVVHIVGPIVDGPLTSAHEEALAACYRNTLSLCAENDLRSVAFCCISTGVFRFPKERAAEIALTTVSCWLKEYPRQIDRVIFNVFSDDDRTIYESLFRRAVF